jgi:hypothetical protein
VTTRSDPVEHSEVVVIRTRTTTVGRLALTGAAALALLVPPLLAGPVLAGAPVEARPAATSEARAGTLKVRVAQLPGTRKVVVRGPHRFKRVLTSTTVLRGLDPGRYRVKAAKVRAETWVAHSEVSKPRVRVRAGRRAVTRVTYPTVVSRSARVLKARDIKDFTAPSTTDPTGEITLSRRAPEGTVLAAGVTPETPYGALVAVLSARKTSAGWVHTVRIAGIQEAVLRGSYDVPIHATTPIQGRLAMRRSPAQARGTSAGCSGSMEAGADLDGKASLNGSFSGGVADWKWYKPWKANPYVQMGLSINANVDARAWAKAMGSCTTGEKTLVSSNLAVIAFSIGPIPVVLVPHLGIDAGASITASGRLELAGGVRADAGATVTVSLRRAPELRGSGPTFDGWSRFDLKASASAEAHLTGRLTILAYGVAGPYAQARVAIVGKADSAANPWWYIDAQGSAGAGVRVGNLCFSFLGCLKLEAGNNELVKGTVRLATADGPRPKAVEQAHVLEGLNATINPDVRAPFPDAIATNWFVPGYTQTTGLGVQLPGGVGELASFVRDDPPDQYGNYIYDVVRTDLEVTPEFNRLRIPWIFGTEQPVGVGRDTAAILVNGTNCAVIGGFDVTTDDATVVNTGQLATRYDRVTPQQYCDLPVTPGVPVKIQLVVAESPNGEYDSALMIGAGGISSYAG